MRASKNFNNSNSLSKKENVSIRLTAKASSRDVTAEKRSESNKSCIGTSVHDTGVKLQNPLSVA